MEKINHSLRSFFSRRKYDRQNVIESSFIHNVYPLAVGKMLARSTKILGYKRGLLTIACKNSIYVTELSHMKEEMIEKINNELKQELVKEIRFVIGNVRVSKPRKRKKVLNQEQKEWVERIVQQAPECYQNQIRSMLVAYKENS
jgi:hypothetical protein